MRGLITLLGCSGKSKNITLCTACRCHHFKIILFHFNSHFHDNTIHKNSTKALPEKYQVPTTQPSWRAPSFSALLLVLHFRKEDSGFCLLATLLALLALGHNYEWMIMNASWHQLTLGPVMHAHTTIFSLKVNHRLQRKPYIVSVWHRSTEGENEWRRSNSIKDWSVKNCLRF